MSLALMITLGLFAGAALLMAAYWLVVLYESIQAIRHLPTLRDALGREESKVTAGSAPAVCVIVPAHNEGANIATIASTLLKQDYPNFRVVFVLDRCTDDTLATLQRTVAGDPRVRILELTQCPPDWVGKVHAVYNGWLQSPEAQSAEYVCFADADTIWKPEALRAALGLMRWRNLGLLSLMTNLTSETWFERIVQPVACYELITQYPPRRVNRTERQRAVANGQFMMFTQRAYKAIGTHKRFKDEILEDQRMAKHVVWKKHLIGFLMADGLLYCRMYREYDRFKSGWKRIYGELAQVRPDRLRRYAARLFTFSVLLPVTTLAGLVVGAIALASTGHWAAWACTGLCAGVLAMWFGLLIAGHRWARAPVSGSLWHVPGAFITVVILLEAARDIAQGRGTTWGGRTYQRLSGKKGRARVIDEVPPDGPVESSAATTPSEPVSSGR